MAPERPDPPAPHDRLIPPAWCPRCNTTDENAFRYDRETDTWVCSRCAATWRRGVPERQQ